MSKHKPLLMQVTAKLGANYNRQHGTETNKAYYSSSRQFCQFLKEKYGLERIDNLKPGHVKAYFEQRIADKVGNSQLARDATVVRDIAEAIGKNGIVPRENQDLGFNRPVSERYDPKTADRAALDLVRERLVQYAEKTGKMVDRALVVAYDVRSTLGLRAKESFTSNVVERGGALFMQVTSAGSKGGKWREVPCDTPEKRGAAEAYRHMAQELGNRSGKLIPPSMDKAEKMYNHQRYVVAEIAKGTKENAANMHSQRHSFVQAEIETKSDPEVQQEIGHGVDRELDHYRQR
jgi:hypothetical protein